MLSYLARMLRNRSFHTRPSGANPLFVPVCGESLLDRRKSTLTSIYLRYFLRQNLATCHSQRCTSRRVPATVKHDFLSSTYHLFSACRPLSISKPVSLIRSTWTICDTTTVTLGHTQPGTVHGDTRLIPRFFEYHIHLRINPSRGPVVDGCGVTAHAARAPQARGSMEPQV